MLWFRPSIYWDNNATTSVSPRVRHAIDAVLKSIHGNPSSPHRVAHDAALVLDSSRQTLATTLGVEAATLHFTGSATEAANQILFSMERETRLPRRILTTPIEHPSVLRTLEVLAERGFEVVPLPVDSLGRLELEALERELAKPTALVCCMLANNETGVIQNVAAVVAAAHRHGALVFSDMVQALGKIPVDLSALGVDYANFSAHKIHGPKGIGLLYARGGSPLHPFVHGGHQEEGRRAGTEALHDISGFAQAARQIPETLANAKAVDAVRRFFAAELLRICPGATFATPDVGCLLNTLSVRFPGTPNTVLLGWLDLHGIAASAGSACNTGSNKPSHVLTALGLSETAARETLRFSLDTSESPGKLRRQARTIVRRLDDFLQGRIPAVEMLTPALLAPLLADPRTLVVDARHGYDRLVIPSLPGAREIGWPFSRHLAALPRDRHIVLVCQVGFDAPLLAWRLHGQGHPHVSFLAAGMLGWKIRA